MSGRKNSLIYPVIKAQAMTQTITSQPTNVQNLDNVSYSVVWTGTPTGTFSVNVSNTYSQTPEGEVLNAGTWIPLTFTPTLTAAAGSAGSMWIDVNQTGAIWIQLVYTFTSGTGTLNATLSAKMV